MDKTKNVYVFIGPPSSGKSYLGKRFAEVKEYTFYEADEDYLPEYRERVKTSKEEIEAVYNEFYSTVINKIKHMLHEFNKPVVVATAIGREKNRQRFIYDFGDDLVLIYVKSPYEKLISNAINVEFPKLAAVTKLPDEKAKEITEHLTKKYHNYEIPRDVIVIENDYTETTFTKLLKLVQ